MYIAEKLLKSHERAQGFSLCLLQLLYTDGVDSITRQSSATYFRFCCFRLLRWSRWRQLFDGLDLGITVVVVVVAIILLLFICLLFLRRLLERVFWVYGYPHVSGCPLLIEIVLFHQLAVLV